MNPLLLQTDKDNIHWTQQMALDVQMERTIKLMTRDDCQITASKWMDQYGSMKGVSRW